MVAEEVDKELLLPPHDQGYGGGGREFTGSSAEIREFLKNKEETSVNDATWARLTEMAGFSAGRFGCFETRLGMWEYNREWKAAILRKFTTDKDSLWGGGLLSPIGNRVAYAASAMTWGTINTDKPGGGSANDGRLYAFHLRGLRLIHDGRGKV